MKDSQEILATLNTLRTRLLEYTTALAEATATRQQCALADADEGGDRLTAAYLAKATRAELAAEQRLKNTALAISELEGRLKSVEAQEQARHHAEMSPAAAAWHNGPSPEPKAA